MMCRQLIDLCFGAFRSLTMMTSRMFMMLGGFAVVFCWLLGHTLILVIRFG